MTDKSKVIVVCGFGSGIRKARMMQALVIACNEVCASDYDDKNEVMEIKNYHADIDIDPAQISCFSDQEPRGKKGKKLKPWEKSKFNL